MPQLHRQLRGICLAYLRERASGAKVTGMVATVTELPSFKEE